MESLVIQAPHNKEKFHDGAGIGTSDCSRGKARPAPTGFTLVHIESDRANALLLRYLMDLKGHHTLYQATDGGSGLELCLQLHPDLILTEMHLPDMNGHELLQRLRAHAATRHTLCIVLSGDAMNNTIERALAAGFDDYWTKPIDVWQFLDKLHEALGRIR